jgi:hypothetical protein
LYLFEARRVGRNVEEKPVKELAAGRVWVRQ